MAGIVRYFQEAREELKKVNWPTRVQVLEGTQTVFIFVIFMTLLIWGMDRLFHYGMGVLLK